MTDWDAFFRLHEGLDRQGPGTPADVAWALATARTPDGARILDAGCGAGADLPALLAYPGATVTAVDTHAPFIDTVRRRFPQVTAFTGSMADSHGPFDLIWCAGALYFLGITEGLRAFAPKLASGGAVAFSEPVWTVDTPPDGAYAHWAEYPAISHLDGLEARVAAADFVIEGTRLLLPEAWAAYYDPMVARIAELRPDADPTLSAALDASEAEIAGWRAHGDSFTYALLVVRPA